MSLDRFIRFKKCPPRKELKNILEDYLNGAGEVVEGKNKHWLDVSLMGNPSFPFRRIAGLEKNQSIYENLEGRWIEIFLDAKHFSVITRSQDEYTNDVAVGIARMLSRYYNGIPEFEREEWAAKCPICGKKDCKEENPNV